MSRIYICIDLKSFYASVECNERGLNPLTTNLVVADSSRTEKTICLAVSPSLKKFGLKGRSRLFEVVSKLKEINIDRKKKNNIKEFIDKSYDSKILEEHKDYMIDYVVAPPQMKKYIEYSSEIYNVYLKYLSPEDIYVYSIDEVFCDITNYLKSYKLTPRELATKMIHDVYKKTGITATCGIGTNMYLAKIAMDIVAKHVEADKYGVRIAGLDEKTYRKRLWTHTPITDFWRVGRGYATTLEENNIHTMGDIALISLNNEELLYKLFGVNAEILIDHAWGVEPCTIEDVKNYKPKNTSMSSGQVLHCPYNYKKTRLIVEEMLDLLSLDLVKKKLLTNQLTLTIGYDISNVNNKFKGEITTDRYGRKTPKHTHGTINLNTYTSSSKIIREEVIKFYDKKVNKELLIRRINISVNNLKENTDNKKEIIYEQCDIFSDYSKEKIEQEKKDTKEEEHLQEIILDIKTKYGKNSILKGMNLKEGGTTIDRNNQIGGHKA